MPQPVVTIAIHLDTSDVSTGEGRVEKSFTTIEKAALQAGKRIKEALGFDWKAIVDAAKRVEQALKDLGGVAGAGRRGPFVDAGAEVEQIERVRRATEKQHDARKKQEMDYSAWWERELSKREAGWKRQNEQARESSRRYVEDRRKQEFDYSQWWERELRKREAAERAAAERAATAARRTAEQRARADEEAVRRREAAVRGVGASGQRLQFAGGTDNDIVRITRISTGLRQAQQESTLFRRDLVASVAAAELLVHAMERVAGSLARAVEWVFMYSARTAELQIAAHAMARANNVSTASVDAQADSIKRLNITTQDAYSTLAKFMQAQLDVRDANKLAVVAQDLAVVAGISTQEEINRLTHAILTLQPEVLRTAGVFLTVEQVIGKVAQQTGRSIQSFSQAEKQQLLLNEVLEYGARVAGTYAAALDNPAKQARSLQRVVEELANALGAPLLGALSTVLRALTAFLETIGKAPGVVWLTVAAAAALTVAILALNATTATWIGNVAGSVIPTLLRLVASMYLVATGAATLTKTIIIGTAGWAALVAVIGLAVYALYSYASAQKELERADERQVDLLTARAAAIKDATEKLEGYLVKTDGVAVAAVTTKESAKALDDAIRLLPLSTQAAVRSQENFANRMISTTEALHEQKRATEDLMRAEARRAAEGARQSFDKLSTEQGETARLLTRQADLQAAIDRFEKQLREKGNQLTGGSAELGGPTSTSDMVDELRQQLAAVDKLLGASGQNAEKFRADVAEITQPIARMAVAIEKMTGTQFESAEAILEWNKISIENKDVRSQVLDLITKQVDALRLEAQRYDGAKGAVNAYTDALERLLATKRTLDYDDTPGAVAQNSEQLTRDVQKNLEAYRTKAVGDNGTSLFETLKSQLGREPGEADFKRQVANLFRTELKQLDKSAQVAAASLGMNYSEYVSKTFAPEVVELMKLVGTLETAADRTQGFTEKLKKTKDEAEKLSDKIAKLRKEVSALAAGGESGYATFQHLDLIKSKIQAILDARAELGVDVGKPVPGIDPRNVDKADVTTLDAQLAIYERQRQTREDIFRLTQRQADAEREVSVLVADALTARVSAETRAHDLYLRQVLERKEAEADLTARLAVEMERRSEAGVRYGEELLTGQAAAVERLFTRERETRNQSLGSIFDLMTENFGEAAFASNPVVQRARELADQNRVSPSVSELKTANNYLASIDRSLAKLAGTQPVAVRPRSESAAADVTALFEGSTSADRRKSIALFEEQYKRFNLYDPSRRFIDLTPEEQTAVGREAERRRALDRENKEFGAQLAVDKYNFAPRTDSAYSSRQRELLRSTELDHLEQIDLLERRLSDLRTAGSREQLAAIQAFQRGRVEAELSTLGELAALREQERSGYLEDARFRRSVEAEAEVARLKERADSARRIILLEEEIKNAGHNAANEYREAWLEAYREVQRRSEDAIKEQIRAQVELADQSNIHSEQVRAGVMKFLASQRSATEIFTDAITGVYDTGMGLIDRGLEKITRRFGALGDVIKDVLSGLVRLTLNRVFMKLLDGLFGAPSGGASQGFGASVLGGLGRALTGGAGGGAGAGGAVNPLSLLFGGAGGGTGAAAAGGLNANALTLLAGGSPIIGMSGNSPVFNAGGLPVIASDYSSMGLQSLSGAATNQQSIFTMLAGAGGGRQAILAGGPFAGLTGIGGSALATGAIAAPFVGASLGGLLGGPSRLGGVLGMAGGGLLGASLTAALAPGFVSALFGGGASAAATGGAFTGSLFGGASAGGGLAGSIVPFLTNPFTIAAAGALLVGAYIIGRNRQRRRDETSRDQIITDSFGQLDALIKAVANDRMDGTDALAQATQIRADYLQKVGQLKDSKARRHAQLDVSRLDIKIDHIRKAAEEQLTRRRNDRLVPEFANGLEAGRIPGAPGSPQMIVAHGGEYVVNSTQQAAIGALVLALAAQNATPQQSSGAVSSRIALQNQSPITSGGCENHFTIEATVDSEGITVTGLRSRRGREQFDVNYNRRKDNGYS